jgi:HK97 family phage portal protein
VKILGITIGRKKSADDLAHFDDAAGGWWPIIREGFAGAWQENITIRRDTLLAFTAVYACVTRICTDIGKVPLCLMRQTKQGIWVPIGRNSPYAPILRRPNDYQTRSQFLQQWVISKKLAGNTYVFMIRDARGIPVKMYVLDPTRVRPLITPDGSIYYQLGYDPLSEQLYPTLVVPQSEIIHDRAPALFHPLVGTSPIFACGMAAAQGHSIQKSSAAFFKNMARPSGILTAPGAIGQDTADRLKKDWIEKFSGKNAGAVAVLGDGLKFEAMTMTAVDAQVIEQLKWSGETVCSAFGVPAFMVGIAPPPPYTNIEALTQQYWSQCLQADFEDIECLMADGLGLNDAATDDQIAAKFDLRVLLKMDTATRYKTWKDAISGGWMAPNEARLNENMPPVKGGDTPYLQVQNYSLAALAARDAEGPPSKLPPSAPPAPDPKSKPNAEDEPPDGDGSPDDDVSSDAAKAIVEEIILKIQKSYATETTK